MKNIYAVLSKNGVRLCYYVATSEKNAVAYARMWGHRRAAMAIFVREHN